MKKKISYEIIIGILLVILGIGSANPRTEDNYIKNEAHAFLGAAMIAVKKTEKETHVIAKDSISSLEVTF